MLSSSVMLCNVVFYIVCVILQAVPIYMTRQFLLNEADNAFLILWEPKILLLSRNKDNGK